MKAFVFDENEAKIAHLDGFRENGERIFNISNGLFLVTNMRFVVYSSDSEQLWRSKTSELEDLEYDNKLNILRIYTKHKNYYEISLSLPRGSIANALTNLDGKQVVAQAAHDRTRRQLAERKDALTLILSFYKELIYRSRRTGI